MVIFFNSCIRRHSCQGVNLHGWPGHLCEMVTVPSLLNFCIAFAAVF
ncbi:unnamed protein product [Staurois parvus]|uniref:Uncharacterized protein n=1 Tax=Staurois parvus TaxID=386267 RepID=A0ABN9D669_9NEOB|nr:unnamed protein product [Staurois parvus]